MSILIKGLEKPESCESCPLEDFGGCMFRVQKGNCPLVEVPPHGRLIDADELADQLTIIPIDLGYREVEDIEKMVTNAPTIIEAEGEEK